MIVKSIETSFLGVKFDIIFKNRLVFIDGDSGVGKTFLFRALIKYATFYKAPIEFINYYIVHGDVNRVKQHIDQYKNKLFIIDNADILLDDELRVKIALDSKNQYLIFGRDVRLLGMTIKNLAALKIVNNVGKLVYEYNYK